MELAPERNWGRAWVALALAVALHVADEALTGFLPLWNEWVLSGRESVSWLPFPTFAFDAWLGGLVVLALVLLALSPLAFRGRAWLRPVAWFLGALMVFNALGHAAASVYLGTPAPGVCSSPLLLAAAVWLLVATRGVGRRASAPRA